MTQEVPFDFFHSTLKIENLEEEGGVSHWENVVVKGPFFCRREFIFFRHIFPMRPHCGHLPYFRMIVCKIMSVLLSYSLVYKISVSI